MTVSDSSSTHSLNRKSEPLIVWSLRLTLAVRDQYSLRAYNEDDHNILSTKSPHLDVILIKCYLVVSWVMRQHYRLSITVLSLIGFALRFAETSYAFLRTTSTLLRKGLRHSREETWEDRLRQFPRKYAALQKLARRRVLEYCSRR